MKTSTVDYDQAAARAAGERAERAAAAHDERLGPQAVGRHLKLAFSAAVVGLVIALAAVIAMRSVGGLSETRILLLAVVSVAAAGLAALGLLSGAAFAGRAFALAKVQLLRAERRAAHEELARRQAEMDANEEAQANASKQDCLAAIGILTEGSAELPGERAARDVAVRVVSQLGQGLRLESVSGHDAKLTAEVLARYSAHLAVKRVLDRLGQGGGISSSDPVKAA